MSLFGDCFCYFWYFMINGNNMSFFYGIQVVFVFRIIDISFFIIFCYFIGIMLVSCVKNVRFYFFYYFNFNILIY